MQMEYNRFEAGDRIRNKRMLIGWSQSEVAEKIERSTKYYADIERGSCGMSIETLLKISSVLDMSMDYMIHGKVYGEEQAKQSDQVTAILSILNNTSENKRNCALRMLPLFLCMNEEE